MARKVWALVVGVAREIPGIVLIAAWVTLGVSVINAWLWLKFAYLWAGLISGFLRDGVALGDVGKPVGYLIEAGFKGGWALLVTAAAAVVIRVLNRRNRRLEAERGRRARAFDRDARRIRPAPQSGVGCAEQESLDAAYDDMVDALERAHELMARGEVKQARHEIERALEEAA